MGTGVEGKVAIVTGGGSGIGRASALRLAAHRARVVVADRDLAAAETVRAEIEQSGATTTAVHIDVSVPSDSQRLVETTVETFGPIDILVHCAGICPRAPLLELSDEDWRRVLAVNLDGTFYVTRNVGRAMAARGSGTMILLTSDRGVYGSGDYPHYAASKGGMIALTKSLAIALGPHGVTVNGLNPGITDTPLARAALTEADWKKRHDFDPLGRHSLPEDIAETVLFLAGTGGRYMTGQIVTTRMRF